MTGSRGSRWALPSLANVSESAGRRVPFLRPSFLRMLVARGWQVGDGREEAVADYVEQTARRGEIGDVLAAIDQFARARSFLINVGDEKGDILDTAVRGVDPSLVLELGTYVGYSALRLARCAPRARVVSLELVAANAAIARRIVEHAGVSDRVSVIEGTLGDADTRQLLRASIAPGGLGAVFLDHAKEHYLSDLKWLEDSGWLRAGSVVIADNVGWPGAPEYRAYMRQQQGARWHTVEHHTRVEHQNLLKDLMLESRYLGPSNGP